MSWQCRGAQIVKLIFSAVCSILFLEQSGRASPLYDCRTDVGTYGAPHLELSNGVTYNEIRQFFAPKLAGVDFVDLFVMDGVGANGRGATMFVEIRDASQDLLLGVSEPITFQDNFGRFATFTFSTQIRLSPGTTYAIVPRVSEFTRDPFTADLVQSDAWNIQRVSGFGQGAAGLAINGMLESGQSLMVREGLTVPEQSVNYLMLMGVVTWIGLIASSEAKK